MTPLCIIVIQITSSQYLNQCWLFCQFDPKEDNSAKFESKQQMVFQSGPMEQTSVKLEWNGLSENPFENLVCKALLILPQYQ